MPVFATLRSQGHASTSFLDDSLLLAKTQQECLTNIVDTLQLLRLLGFIVYPDKSVFKPTQRIQYLGMTIDYHYDGNFDTSKSKQSCFVCKGYSQERESCDKRFGKNERQNIGRISSGEIRSATLLQTGTR